MWPRPPTPWAQAADAVSYQSDTRNDRPQPTKDMPSDERLSDMALAFRQPSPDDRPARHSLPTLESRATSPRARPRPSASAGQADQAPVLTAPTLPAAESPPQTQSPSLTAAAAHPPPPPAAAAAAAPLPRAEGQNRKTQNAYRKAHSLDGPDGVENPKGPCTNCLKSPSKRNDCRTPRNPTPGKANACNHCSRSKMRCEQPISA
ncbi:hypothetical protein PG989_007560 [Apiospora arundinis]